MAERTIQETLAQTVRQQLGYTPSKLDGHIKRLLSGDADPKNDLAGLVDRLLDAATINHTELFRHPEQFREFEERLRSLEARQSTISIWSAACATGEEAYSIAQVVRRRNVNASILATDISDAALAEARNPSPRRAKRLAQQGISDPEALRGMIQFTRHSLVSPLPSHLPQTFDFIFCRNVLIYFSPADASALLGRLVRRIASAGSLFVAPVESLLGTPEGFVAGETLGVFNRTQAETKVPSGPTGIQSETERREIQLLSDVLEDDDQEASESRVRQIVSEDPKDPLGWFVLAELLTRRGEKEQARSCYAKALSLTDQQTTPLRSMLRAVLEGRMLTESPSAE